MLSSNNLVGFQLLLLLELLLQQPQRYMVQQQQRHLVQTRRSIVVIMIVVLYISRRMVAMTSRMTTTTTTTSTTKNRLYVQGLQLLGGRNVQRRVWSSSPSIRSHRTASLSLSQQQQQQSSSLTTKTTVTTNALDIDDNEDDDTESLSSSSSLRPPSSQIVSKRQFLPSSLSSSMLVASRLGLDPKNNRFHSPIVYHEKYSFDGWPDNHTFPMDKFCKIAYALQNACQRTIGTSTLPRPLVRQVDDFFRPLDYNTIPIHDWLLRDNDDMYRMNHGMDDTFVRRFINGQLTKEEERYIGFREQTSRPELIERTILEVAGTILTAQLAYMYGIASNVAGGTHHAHPTGGAGYTILNDLAITANLLTRRERKKKKEEEMSTITTANTTTTTNDAETSSSSSSSFILTPPLERILVIDLDVHQGDGTAKFCTLWKETEQQQQQDQDEEGRNDDTGSSGTTTTTQRLFTLSMHCASNYPQLKAHSTYDIGLRDGCTDEEYMDLLVLWMTKALSDVQPDLVLYDAGVDVYMHDKLGRLKLTEDGIRRRDRYVLDTCVSLGIPVAAVVGGGYDKDIDALARRHAIVHEECAYVWRKYQMWKR